AEDAAWAGELPGAVRRIAAACVRRRRAPVPACHRPDQWLPGGQRTGPGADGALGGLLADPWRGPGVSGFLRAWASPVGLILDASPVRNAHATVGHMEPK